MEENVWIFFGSLLKVTIWHDLEHKPKNSCKELGSIFILRSKFAGTHFVINEMDDVHFKIHQFSIDGVLRGRVEMELSSVELSTRDVLVEQTDGRSVHPVESSMVIIWFLRLLQWERVRLNGLIELVRCLWINVLVVEPKPIVLEVSHNWDVGLKIDRGPLDHVSWLILVVAFPWSLLDWILPCL